MPVIVLLLPTSSQLWGKGRFGWKILFSPKNEEGCRFGEVWWKSLPIMACQRLDLVMWLWFQLFGRRDNSLLSGEEGYSNWKNISTILEERERLSDHMSNMTKWHFSFQKKSPFMPSTQATNGGLIFAFVSGPQVSKSACECLQLIDNWSFSTAVSMWLTHILL